MTTRVSSLNPKHAWLSVWTDGELAGNLCVEKEHMDEMIRRLTCDHPTWPLLAGRSAGLLSKFIEQVQAALDDQCQCGEEAGCLYCVARACKDELEQLLVDALRNAEK